MAWQTWKKQWMLDRIEEDKQMMRDDDNHRLGEQFADDSEAWDVVMDSTCVDHILYDPEREHLQVKFQSGNKYYDFPYVPKKLVEEWINTDGSKGQYYHEHIEPYSIMEK